MELFRISPKTGTGDLIISVQAIEPLRVPIPSIKQERDIVKIFDKINKRKRVDPTTNTDDLEKKNDALVYQLYGLTDEEIQIVEESVK